MMEDNQNNNNNNDIVADAQDINNNEMSQPEMGQGHYSDNIVEMRPMTDYNNMNVIGQPEIAQGHIDNIVAQQYNSVISQPQFQQFNK